MAEPLLALTVLAPWPWAIFRAGKPLENRSWRPPHSLIGKRFAIHSGKSTTELLDPEVADFIEAIAGKLWKPEEIVLGAVVGTVRLASVVTASKSPWYAGKFGWLLEEKFELPRPIPCRGMQGLWALPPDVEAQVRAQEDSRRANG